MSDVLLVLGAALLVAGVYFGIGLAAALAAGGVVLILVALAWEAAGRGVEGSGG